MGGVKALGHRQTLRNFSVLRNFADFCPPSPTTSLAGGTIKFISSRCHNHSLSISQIARNDISEDWPRSISFPGRTFPKWPTPPCVLRKLCACILRSPYLHVSCHVTWSSEVTWSRGARTWVFTSGAATITLWCGVKTTWYVNVNCELPRDFQIFRLPFWMTSSGLKSQPKLSIAKGIWKKMYLTLWSALSRLVNTVRC